MAALPRSANERFLKNEIMEERLFKAAYSATSCRPSGPVVFWPRVQTSNKETKGTAWAVPFCFVVTTV
jgi:hypothetical protein